MLFALVTLISALSIAGVAAVYSIIGLATLFGAAKVPVMIMAGTLEVGKLVAASWLYRNWKIAPKFIRAYLTVAVVVLVFITSMGIFGFLSRAHLEQIQPQYEQAFKVEQLKNRISTHEQQITRYNAQVELMDKALERLRNNGYISISLQRLEEQRPVRDQIDQSIQAQYVKIEVLNSQIIAVQQKIQQIATEVGPLKYVAELIYKEDIDSNLDNAVRYVILILIFVFDPLAVSMVVAANMSFMNLLKRRATTQGKDLPKILDAFAELQEQEVVAHKVKKKEPEIIEEIEYDEDGNPIRTERDFHHREVSKDNSTKGKKRIDPWTGKLRWRKAKYDGDD